VIVPIYVIDLATGAVEMLTLEDLMAAVDLGCVSVKTHEISLDPKRASFLRDAIRDANTRTDTVRAAVLS
jgi:hypothetical protein